MLRKDDTPWQVLLSQNPESVADSVLRNSGVGIRVLPGVPCITLTHHPNVPLPAIQLPPCFSGSGSVPGLILGTDGGIVTNDPGSVPGLKCRRQVGWVAK